LTDRFIKLPLPGITLKLPVKGSAKALDFDEDGKRRFYAPLMNVGPEHTGDMPTVDGSKLEHSPLTL
jgi:hypothetical protein